MIISLSWGWKYGLLSATLGLGAQTMWILWLPKNGWAPFVAIPFYTLWIVWHGWCAENKKKGILSTFYGAEIPFRILYAIVLVTLFSWSFKFNPSPWAPQMKLTTAPSAFVNFLQFKCIFEGYIILLLADVLLNFNIVKNILLLKEKVETKSGYIISGALLFGLVFWIISGIAGSLFSSENVKYYTSHSTLTLADSLILNVPPHEFFIRVCVFLICIVAGLLISRYYSQSKKAEGKLRENEKQLRSLLQSIQVGVVVHGPDTKIIHFNKESQKLLRLPEEQMYGKKAIDPSWQFYKEDGNNMPLEDYPVNQVINNKNVVSNFIVGIRNSDEGNIVWLLANGVPEFDADGNISRVIVTFVDVTERRQAEDALQKAHDELEQRVDERTVELKNTHAQLLHSGKLSAIGGLSASIAHEFNNPLAGITNVIHGLKRRATYDEDDGELIEMAIKECARIKNLIKSLQDFNRPSSGRVAPMDIHSTIDSILLLSKKEYQNKGITVETDYAKDMPQIKAVADQVKQVLLNLLNNAVYACEGGGSIKINTEAKNKNIVIQIQDNGKGITLEDIGYIFDPFFTTKPEVKGTGLGLSVSYGIIKRHGGRIDVESVPAQGTIFTIILPIEGSKDAEQSNPAS